jgi:hypothetical protein
MQERQANVKPPVDAAPSMRPVGRQGEIARRVSGARRRRAGRHREVVFSTAAGGWIRENAGIEPALRGPQPRLGSWLRGVPGTPTAAPAEPQAVEAGDLALDGGAAMR